MPDNGRTGRERNICHIHTRRIVEIKPPTRKRRTGNSDTDVTTRRPIKDEFNVLSGHCSSGSHCAAADRNRRRGITYLSETEADRSHRRTRRIND